MVGLLERQLGTEIRTDSVIGETKDERFSVFRSDFGTRVRADSVIFFKEKKWKRETIGYSGIVTFSLYPTIKKDSFIVYSIRSLKTAAV